MHGTHAGNNAPLLGGFKWLPWGPPFAMHEVGGWKRNVGIQVPMGLDDRRQATGQDSGEWPKIVTYVY